MSENLLNNKAITSLIGKAAPKVVSAIKTASARTGVNFAYLMEQAAAESSFNAKAKSRTSSAAGLYQFIESTWLDMVKKYGDKHGLGELSEAIGANGKVSDKALRREILDLRNDPEKAALLAAEFAAENKRYLDQHAGGEIGSTELYLAHFLGASGAAGFINAYRENPLATAADIFPKAARANYNVFYDRKTGEARTMAGVYDFFAKKFGASSGAPAIASAPTKPPVPPRMPASFEETASQLVMKPFSDEQPTARPQIRTVPAARISALVLSPAEIMLMTDMKMPADEPAERVRQRAQYAYNQ